MVVLKTKKLYYFFFFPFSFSLSVSMVFIRTYFSLLPSVSLTLPPPPPPSLAPDKRERPFVLLQTICSLDYSRVLGLQKVRAVLWSERLCTDWRSSVMETLAVILDCR